MLARWLADSVVTVGGWSTAELRDFRQAAAWQDKDRRTFVWALSYYRLARSYPKSLLQLVNASSDNGSQAYLLHLLYGQQRLRPEQRISNITLNSPCATSKRAEPKSRLHFRGAQSRSWFGAAESCQYLEEILAQFATYFQPTESPHPTVVWVYSPI